MRAPATTLGVLVALIILCAIMTVGSPYFFSVQNLFDKHYIAFTEPHPEDAVILGYLPEFSRRVELPELPGWIVYTRRN